MRDSTYTHTSGIAQAASRNDHGWLEERALQQDAVPHQAISLAYLLNPRPSPLRSEVNNSQ